MAKKPNSAEAQAHLTEVAKRIQHETEGNKRQRAMNDGDLTELRGALRDVWDATMRED